MKNNHFSMSRRSKINGVRLNVGSKGISKDKPRALLLCSNARG